MSWKNVKEHYRIGHAVHVRAGCICIGSPYVPDLIVIGLDGAITKRDDYARTNNDLARYLREMDADPAKLKELIAAPDMFAASIPVFTYDGGDIIEKRCEVLGWPNVTHDGCLMYENTFSPNRAKIVKAAKTNAACGINAWRDRIAEAEKDIAKFRAYLEKEEADLAKLEALP